MISALEIGIALSLVTLASAVLAARPRRVPVRVRSRTQNR